MSFVSPSPEVISSADEISSFVSWLAREYFLDGPDRRSEPRYRVTLPVNVRPLDDLLKPVGYQVRAVTRDISTGGIGLVCQDPVSAKHIAIQLSGPNGERIEFIVEVLRCESVGYYFDVGCKFVVDSVEPMEPTEDG